MIFPARLFREHRNVIFPVIFVLVVTQVSFLRELFGLQRVHHGTGIAWCCEALVLLGIVSALLGISSVLPGIDRRETLIGTGILVTFVSLIIQFSVWETIGKYSMFYESHPSQNISEPQYK